MARRRPFRSMVQIPGLGVFNKSVNTTDVLVGAAIGFGGTLLLKGLGNKMLAGMVPDALLKGSPFVGSAVSGALAYQFTKKNMGKANAYLFGSLMAGAAVQAWDVLKTSFPEGLGDVVSLKLSQYGVQIDEPRQMQGLIVDETSRSQQNLAELAAYSSLGEDQTGIEDLMSM